MWWISHRTLASIALLMLRTWFHIEVPLIPLLIHSWMSLPKTFFLRPTLPSLPLKLPHATENIDSILDDQIVSTRDRVTRPYVIKWKGRPDSENSWITDDFRQLNPDLLERYQSQQHLSTTHSTGSSLFQEAA